MRNSDSIFIICCFLAVVLFYGEPSLMTALIHFLMKP